MIQIKQILRRKPSKKMHIIFASRVNHRQYVFIYNLCSHNRYYKYDKKGAVKIWLFLTTILDKVAMVIIQNKEQRIKLTCFLVAFFYHTFS